jgi:hypothetical protein
MKNLQKGFIVPTLIMIVVLLAIVVGVYVFKQGKPKLTEQRLIANNQDNNKIETSSSFFVDNDYGKYDYYLGSEPSSGEISGISAISGWAYYSTSEQMKNNHPEIRVYVRKMKSVEDALKFYNIEQQQAESSNQFSQKSFSVDGNSLKTYIFHGLDANPNVAKSFFTAWVSNKYTISVTYTFPTSVTSIDEVIQGNEFKQLVKDYLVKYENTN